MKINAKSSYALNILGYLILQKSNEDNKISSRVIASQYALSESFVILVARQLRMAGLIKSHKGPNGGHWISKPIDSITVGDIFEAIKDDKEEEKETKQLELFVDPFCKNLMEHLNLKIDELNKLPIAEFCREA